MKICTECKGKMVGKGARTPEGISYRYFKCNECWNEIVDMKQLHHAAEKYRTVLIL